ncbi:MAG: peptidoglycan DD-metalloendopeptidase family protein [Solibacillus sp.]
MKTKSSYKIIAGVLTALLITQAPAAYATSLSDLKEEKSEIEQQKKELNKSIDQKSNEIQSNQNTQQKIIAQLEELGAKITKTNASIEKVTSAINEANEEIGVLEADIKNLEDKIKQRDKLLAERARAIQTSGTVSYIDVLLGANSFVDFIDRFSAVNTLMDADRQIMREQKEDKEALEAQKVKLEQRKKELEANKAELDRLMASLKEQKSQKNKLVDQLEAEQKRLKGQKQLLEEEYSEAIEVSKELENKIAAEQRRIAEIARKEAARRAAEAAAKSKGSSASTGSADTPAVAAGTWTKPTNGRFTSAFGWRNIGAGNEFHLGIDLANSIGTPIVSAADGVVSYVGSMSGYGKVMMVTHSINDSTWTTVYAHLSAFSASVGDSVEKGEQIAKMGNTGRSTGPHLHFEIHNGEWNGKRSNAVNPLRYISL